MKILSVLITLATLNSITQAMITNSKYDVNRYVANLEKIHNINMKDLEIHQWPMGRHP